MITKNFECASAIEGISNSGAAAEAKFSRSKQTDRFLPTEVGLFHKQQQYILYIKWLCFCLRVGFQKHLWFCRRTNWVGRKRRRLWWFFVSIPIKDCNFGRNVFFASRNVRYRARIATTSCSWAKRLIVSHFIWQPINYLRVWHRTYGSLLLRNSTKDNVYGKTYLEQKSLSPKFSAVKLRRKRIASWACPCFHLAIYFVISETRAQPLALFIFKAFFP